jgi:hypothetical protein
MGWIAFSIAVFFCLALLVSWLRERTAESRGMALFLDNLTEEQRRQYRTSGYFECVGSITGNCYRIYHGKSRNVVKLDLDNARSGRCFAPQGDLVEGDCMLGQKIAIENYEEDVIKTALPF